MGLPTGTVTFLFTDIEGSTKLLQELRQDYAAVQRDHQRLMREAIAQGGGTELRTEGDSFFAVFPSAEGALRTAVEAQRALDTHAWSHGRPLRVRMGMHTGEGRLADGDDYLGIDVNRAARIAAAGHGGQVLLSDATRSVVEHELPEGVTVRDLGGHRLKDLAHPEHLYDLVIEGLPADFAALKTLEAPVYLPAQLTSFVGRSRELEQLMELVDGTRLVTLTGPGGTGKTRLAVEAAGRLADGFADGTYFVDLSPITDPRLVPDTIASALKLPTEGGRPSMELLSEHLRDRRVLLVLDNFEQVLPGGEAVSTLLRTARGLRALVTSRGRLGLSGEQELPVPPLAVPNRGDDADRLRRSEAIALFAERASAVQPGFTLAEDTLPVAAEICARLDGLPLAIELAASRLRVLPLGRMLEQLDRRLPTLVGGPRDAPSRQQTLRSTIAWSYDLLNGESATFFRRLSVFAGGWSLDMADDVANANAELGDTVHLTESLIQHSLVDRVDDPEGRFRMLETIREFGLEQLGEVDEARVILERHAHRFLDLAERAEAHMNGPEQMPWLARLTVDNGNLRAALSWLIDQRDAESGLRLVGSLWRFWHVRGQIEEARRWIDTVLALPGAGTRSVARARALTALGGISYWQSDFDTSLASYEEALDLYRQLGETRRTVEALYNLGTARGVMGDGERAYALMEESLSLARSVGDRRGEAWGLWGLGAARMFQGDLEGARRYSEQSVPLFEEVGDRWGLSNALTAVGGVTAAAGNAEDARPWILRALEVTEELQNQLAIANEIDIFARLDSATGRHERAVRLAGAAAAVKERLKGQGPDAFMPFPDPRDVAAKVMDETAIERAWDDGKSMSLDEAIAEAREAS